MPYIREFGSQNVSQVSVFLLCSSLTMHAGCISNAMDRFFVLYDTVVTVSATVLYSDLVYLR